jgi:hypothetical protein
VFSPEEHKIYFVEMEPSWSVQIYEQQYTQRSWQWHYQWSSPMLTFPIDAIPVWENFLVDTFTQTPQKEQPM